MRRSRRRWAWLPLSLLLAVVAAGCDHAVPNSPEAIVDGELRSGTQVSVAPAQYRSGVIDQRLAAVWIARMEAEYRRWYASPMLDQMIDGLHNVVGALEKQAGPIVTSVDIVSVNIPAATVTGDEATVDEASITYVTHLAPGTWGITEIPGSTGCWYTLHRTTAGWRITDATCNVSGG